MESPVRRSPSCSHTRASTCLTAVQLQWQPGGMTLRHDFIGRSRSRCFSYSNISLRHDFLDRRTKVNLQPLLTGHFEPARIEPELVQYRRVNIGYIVTILYGVKT